MTFVLSKPALVEFVVFRVAPDCDVVARFRVKGRAGRNRVRFRARLNGRTLRPGTYVIRGQALRASGEALAETKLVISKRRPSPRKLAAARAANTCTRAETAGLSTFASALWGGTGLFGGAGNGGTLLTQGGEGTPIRVAGKEKAAAGVLGVRFSRAADAVREVPALVFVLLGIAIGLLAAAAVPLRFVPSARIAAALAYRRTFVAMAGAIALTSVAVVYALA